MSRKQDQYRRAEPKYCPSIVQIAICNRCTHAALIPEQRFVEELHSTHGNASQSCLHMKLLERGGKLFMRHLYRLPREGRRSQLRSLLKTRGVAPACEASGGETSLNRRLIEHMEA
jgi:hypothetical protein